ncbi:CCA tRNA nucleotidyltransferase, mitochondrial [Entomortierella lignicola]|nr:CCA tRNA nucleotidyltransferase, mitochondrial [Entomortierella lignicola]
MDKNNTLIDNRILSINNNSNNRFNEFSKRSFTCSAASLQNGGFDRSRSSTDAHRGSRSNSNTDADTHKGSRSNGNVSRSTEAQKPSPPRQMSVELTKREASIFRMLDRVAEDYEAMTGQRMHLRVAGGWVRDKLLGLESSDIDIGVDKMLGHEFAALVKEDMASRGVKTRPIVKIGSNPEKSKYLETAIMYIHGVHVDFANLRSDIYDDSSRYLNDPVFGTPYEDAHYRDFTINALFYNIRTNAIEDFTGRGLDDLKNGLIRTPLNAIETFWQDPLRVLRCLRFAGRFQFKIAGDATNAIMEPRIRQALRSKVSEERKGKEINKILEDDVARSTALRLLHELGLYDIIFPEPTISVLAKGTSHVHGHRGDVDNAFKLEWIMEWLLKINPMVTRSSIESSEFPFKAEQDLAQEQLLKQSQGLPITTHIYPIVRTENPSKEITEREMIEIKNGSVATLTTRRLLLGTLLFPFHKVIATTNEKTISGAAWVCKYCLKSTTRDILYVSTLQSNLGRVRRSVEANWDSERKEELEQGQQQEQEQEQEGQLSQGSAELASMGLLIKSIGASMPYGNEWPGAFLYGLGVELLPNFEQLKQGILDGDSKAKIAKYNTFFSKAEAYGLEHCYSWKSIISSLIF